MTNLLSPKLQALAKIILCEGFECETESDLNNKLPSFQFVSEFFGDQIPISLLTSYVTDNEGTLEVCGHESVPEYIFDILKVHGTFLEHIIETEYGVQADIRYGEATLEAFPDWGKSFKWLTITFPSMQGGVDGGIIVASNTTLCDYLGCVLVSQHITDQPWSWNPDFSFRDI